MLVRLVLAIRPTVTARPVALACLTVDRMGKKALFFEFGGTNGGTNQILICQKPYFMQFSELDVNPSH